MGMSPCCEKTGLKKGPWTPEEDQKLIAFIEKHGHGSWRALPAKAGLRRCGKSCRLRWTNYLRPDIKRGKFSLQEEQTIIQLHALLGNRWSSIASHLPKRTDNEIKNYWNTHLKKRLDKMGIDPTTHKLKIESLVHSKDSSNLSHMAQWETARLEAEARLTRESKLQEQQNNLGSTSYPTTPQATRLVLNKITLQQHLSLSPCLDVLKASQNSWSNNDDNNNNKYLSLNKKKGMHVHSMYAMMLATDDNLESPTSTLSFPESVQMINNSNNNKNNNNHNNNNNSNAELVSTNHVGLMNESYLLPPTTVDEFINKKLGKKSNEGAIIATLNNGGGDSKTFEEVVVETDDKGIMYDTMMMMSCLHDDNDGNIMVDVEALSGAGCYGNNNNNNDVVGFVNGFDSNDDLTVENLQANFEESKDYWNGMLSYK